MFAKVDFVIASYIGGIFVAVAANRRLQILKRSAKQKLELSELKGRLAGARLMPGSEDSA